MTSGDKRYRDTIPAVKAVMQKGERVTMSWVAQELIQKREKRGRMRDENVQRAVGNEQDRKTLLGVWPDRLVMCETFLY